MPLTLPGTRTWLIVAAAVCALAGCYPDEADDDVADDDATAADDDDATPGDDDDTTAGDDDTDPQGDQDHDGYTPADGDCDDNDPALNLDDTDGDGHTTCDGDCDDADPALQLDDTDGDGHTTCDGDCDDHEAAIYPGAEDVCDALDNDCDGEVNEDTPAAGDAYEPNDVAGVELGDLTASQQTVEGYLSVPGDEDRFRFEVDDRFLHDFWVEAELTSVPASVDVALELIKVQDAWNNYVGLTLDTSNSGGAGEGESVNMDGTWDSDAGLYEVAVTSASGTSCETPFVLVIDCGG